MDQSQLTITAIDKTALVEIFVWIPLSISFLGVVTRLATKLAILRKLQLEDLLISLAFLVSVGQSSAVAIQCANGFGKHILVLSEEEKIAIFKSEYAAGPLYIITVALAKISIVVFTIGLTPNTTYQRMSKVLGVAIILWAVASCLAALLQCQLPLPWDFLQQRCFDQIAFWKSVAIINIVTDAGLLLTIAVIIMRIQTPWARRITIVCIFGTRIFVIVATGFQLYYLGQHIVDPTFDPWAAVICTQIIQCLSIITACIPYLKPFLASLESGLMRADDLQRRGLTTLDPQSQSTPNSLSILKRKITGTKRSSNGNSTIAGQELTQFRPDTRIHPHVTEIATNSGDNGDWDGESQSSRSKIIQETRTWSVNVQSAESTTN